MTSLNRDAGKNAAPPAASWHAGELVVPATSGRNAASRMSGPGLKLFRLRLTVTPHIHT